MPVLDFTQEWTDGLEGYQRLFNRSVVTLLASPAFYAGDKVTGWFSLLLVVVTMLQPQEQRLIIFLFQTKHLAVWELV